MGTIQNPAIQVVDGVFQYSDGTNVPREFSEREIWISASRFTSLTGSAALTAATSLVPGWDMDTTTNTGRGTPTSL